MVGDEEDRVFEIEGVIQIVVVDDDSRAEEYPNRNDCCGRQLVFRSRWGRLLLRRGGRCRRGQVVRQPRRQLRVWLDVILELLLLLVMVCGRHLTCSRRGKDGERVDNGQLK